MAKVGVEVRYPVVDIPQARNRIHDTMVDFVKDTLTIWISAATNVVPVWSGASRASFLKLANQVNYEIEIESLIVAPIGSRIPLGYQTSTGVIIADARGSAGLYGWDYESTLFYIDIVDGRVRFIEAGNQAIEGITPTLPPIPTKRERKKK